MIICQKYLFDWSINSAYSEIYFPYFFQYEELITNFTFGHSQTSEEKDVIIRAMNQSHGNIAKASLELFQEKKSLDLLNNIWGKDVGYYTNEKESVCDKPYHLVADESVPEEVGNRKNFTLHLTEMC